MGLFDDDDFELDELLESVKKYPSCVVDLNEGEVQAIFDRCLYTGSGRITFAKFMQQEFAGKESEMIEFSEDKIVENANSILYLLGQLKGVHEKARLIPIEYGIIDYNSKKWTRSADILFKLYELGCAVLAVCPCVLQKDGKSLATDVSKNKPTLSPKDPAFPEWWEQHKAEWED